jgi:hypothetical protein
MGDMSYDEPRLVWTKLGCPSRTSERGGKGDCVKPWKEGESMV